MDYNKTTLIKDWFSGTAANPKIRVSFPNTFMIKKVWLVATAAGTDATHRFRVSDSTGVTHYVDQLIGTFSDAEVISITVPEEHREFAGGTAVSIGNVVNTSAGYDVYILCAHME